MLLRFFATKSYGPPETQVSSQSSRKTPPYPINYHKLNAFCFFRWVSATHWQILCVTNTSRSTDLKDTNLGAGQHVSEIFHIQQFFVSEIRSVFRHIIIRLTAGGMNDRHLASFCKISVTYTAFWKHVTKKYGEPLKSPNVQMTDIIHPSITVRGPQESELEVFLRGFLKRYVCAIQIHVLLTYFYLLLNLDVPAF